MEEVLHLIEKCKFEKSKILDLSNYNLIAIPEEVFELNWVESLSVKDNNLKELGPISKLKNLVRIDCSHNEIKDLSELSMLSKLVDLNFHANNVADISFIENLTQLKELSLGINPIEELSYLASTKALNALFCGGLGQLDTSILMNLKNLVNLVCWGNNINSLDFIKGLTYIINLNIHHNPISNLQPISNLFNLKSINCSESSISDISPLSKNKKLNHIDCHDNNIDNISPLSSIKKLTHLICYNNKITDFSPIEGLKFLKEIKFSDNPVVNCSSIPKTTSVKLIDLANTKVNSLMGISFHIRRGIPVLWKEWIERNLDGEIEVIQDTAILIKNTPLICPPLEIAQHSPQAVRDYFEELGEDGQLLNEVKIIFLGEASAGKTSLVKRLMNEPFDNKESQTHGIRIRKAPLYMNDGDEVVTHFWDFGGQEVMHATHQFFLSQRSIYVLLLNSRNDDQAEKWLKHATSFGGTSPILIVLNKIDENPSFEVERKTLRQKYPQIKGFYRISCKNENDKGLDEFKEALRQEVDQATTRLTPFPKHWLAVKEHFFNMQSDFIESEEYQKICAAHGVNRQVSQDVLLQFLHDLGVVINFRNLQYFDTQILNPLWLTNGVYRIINSEKVVDNAGILHEYNFDGVINDPRYKKSDTPEQGYTYPKNKLQYIVRVMEEFELCFRLDNKSYVIPQLLPVNAPDWQPEGAKLQFVIHFPEFLPDSVFPRLMVKLHTFIYNDQRWRTGMILHKPNVFNALAQVRWDKEDKKILIDVCGEERRRFLSFIRETLKEIAKDFTKLDYSELVPIPGSKEFWEYEGLVEAEKAGEKDIFVWQVKQKLKVADLLDGVEEASMRDLYEQLPVNAFVSYAHKDMEHLKDLKTALAPLVRLQKLKLWDDREIDAGTEWQEEINFRLNEADIVICLISADFIASDFCFQKEFEIVFEAHQKNKKIIVPVLLRKTDWTDLSIAKLKGVPDEWINSSKNKDEAWTKVSEYLRPILDKIIKQRIKKGPGRPRLIPLDQIKVDPNLPPLN